MRWILRLSLTFAVVFTLAACGSTSAAPTATQSLAVKAKEFGFGPSQLTVTSGQSVELSFQNTGAVEHDWSVREIELAGTPTATEETGGGHMSGDAHDAPKLHVAAGPGGQGKLTFTPSKVGTYEVLCTVPGHKEAGMVGILTVKAP